MGWGTGRAAGIWLGYWDADVQGRAIGSEQGQRAEEAEGGRAQEGHWGWAGGWGDGGADASGIRFTTCVSPT